MPLLSNECSGGRNIHSFVYSVVAVHGEWVAGLGRVCTEKQDAIDAIVKLRVPGEVSQVVDEPDRVDPALGNIPLQAFFVPLSSLIDASGRKSTLDEA